MNTRQAVIERDNACCITCKRAGDSVHHVVKRGHAKVCRMINSKYNLVVKCQKCHDKAHNQKSRYEDMQYLINKYGVEVYEEESHDFWREILRRGENG